MSAFLKSAGDLAKAPFKFVENTIDVITGNDSPRHTPHRSESDHRRYDHSPSPSPRTRQRQEERRLEEQRLKTQALTEQRMLAEQQRIERQRQDQLRREAEERRVQQEREQKIEAERRRAEFEKKQSQEIEKLLERGQKMLDTGKCEDAIIQFQSALQIQPKHFAANAQLRKVYRIQGDQLYCAGKLTQAIRKYREGGGYTKILEILQEQCAHADKQFAQATLEDVLEAKKQYQLIDKSLSETSRFTMLKADLSNDYENYLSEIKRKISACDNAIADLEKRRLIERADAELRSFTMGSSLEELRNNSDFLLQLEARYGKLCHHSTLHQQQEVHQLLSQVHERLEPLEMQELSRYSLYKENHLETIKAQCDRWLALKKAPSPLLEKKQKVIDGIKEHACIILKQLECIPTLGSRLVESYLASRNGFLRAEDEKALNALFEEFSQKPQVRYQVIRLTPHHQFAFFENKLLRALDKLLVRTSLFSSCCSATEYTFKNGVNSWMLTLPLDTHHIFQDISERFMFLEAELKAKEFPSSCAAKESSSAFPSPTPLPPSAPDLPPPRYVEVELDDDLPA